jgi:ribosomal protein L37AE/L43A
MHPAKMRPAAQLLLAALAVLGTAAGCGYRSTAPQPILYSHNIHATRNGIACPFCHFNALRGNSAGIPSVGKCMSCHRVIAAGNPEVGKVARFFSEKKPIPWNRVTELPDHVYFPHYKMVNAGIACLHCHPGMDKVDTAVQTQAFTMGWCMDCHRKRSVSIDCWTCHK